MAKKHKNSRVHIKTYFPDNRETNGRYAEIYLDDMHYIIENYEYGKIHSTKPGSYVSKELGIELAEISADAFVCDYQLYPRNDG
tara:strand:+ start:298 stop:549 length:252 start_codon:yes stop_codon:yes gene_type:complete